MNKQEYKNPVLVRRRFYLEPATLTWLDKQAKAHNMSTSQYLDKLIEQLIKEGA